MIALAAGLVLLATAPQPSSQPAGPSWEQIKQDIAANRIPQRVVVLRRKEAGTTHWIYVYGESHYKTKKTAARETALIDRFPVIGLEGGFGPQIQQAPGGKMFSLVLEVPARWISKLTGQKVQYTAIQKVLDRRDREGVLLEENYKLDSGFKAGILYIDFFILRALLAAGLRVAQVVKARRSRAGPVESSRARCAQFFKIADKVFTYHLLATLVPAFLLRGYSWAWVINPIAAMTPGSYSTVTARNHGMAAATQDLEKSHAQLDSILVIMGLGHVSGYIDSLIKDHGYERVPL